MKVLEERLVYLFTLFCKDLLCSCFHFGSRTFICMSNIFVFPPPSPIFLSWVLVNSLILTLTFVQHYCVFRCRLGILLDDQVIIWINKSLYGYLWQNSDEPISRYFIRSLATEPRFHNTVNPNWI